MNAPNTLGSELTERGRREVEVEGGAAGATVLDPDGDGLALIW